MIHYALRCGNGHEFDGWFKSSAGFDAQAQSGLLDCPACASTDVTRALMAPRISAGASGAGEGRPAETTTNSQPDAALPGKPAPGLAVATPAASAPVIPDGMRAVLQRMRSDIEKHCEYVGPNFAQELRRMAGKDTARRPVYGEATPDEAAALADDGIDVARIPWVPRADS
jgi:hypothetical protein